jgi:uncharacterized protein
MRLVLFVASLLALTFAGYVAISGFFLAKTLTGILTAGPVSSRLATAERPTDPLALGYRGNPMEALGLPFKIVKIETPLGPAEAWQVDAEGAAVGQAIYVHGLAGAREDGYRHLSMLHEAGWSVLLISYRNDAAAPPDPDRRYTLGLREWPDLEAAVAHLAPGPDGPGVLIVAESMGGALLGQFLAQSDLASRVRAIALDSPALSFDAVVRHLAGQGGSPFSGLTAWATQQIMPRLTDLSLQDAEVQPIFTDFAGPIFIAHGSGDRLVPIGLSQALATERSGKTVTLWSAADHLGSYAEDPAAYRSAFQGFVAGIND